MKKYYWLIVAFATMLVACSKDSESIGDSTLISKGNTPVAAQQPVTFGAYVNRATTRAGMVGPLTTSTGIDNLQTKGFGVIAYYTDDKPYSSSSQPNFMYNTKVSGANWEYEPIRYWPNENSANDASEGIDRVSFFAYAPYVQVYPVSGMVKEDDESGIVYMNRNGAVGDPFVNYHVNFIPSEQVDFCWGVNKTTGKPNVNMTKQAVNEKVEFQFNHALAALNVQVDALSDLLSHPADPIDDKEVADKTKIYVRSVTFEGFADKGSFNLNTASDKVMWYDVAGNDYIDGSTVIVHDGRTNGYEGGLGSEAVNELPKGLNPVIVQSAPYDDPTLTAGVTKTSVNLFDNTSNEAPVYVIPTGQPLKMTIVYDVETQVDGLPGYLSDGVKHGTSVENKITKTIKLNDGSIMKLEAGKKYTINLHLGMSSVKYDAAITGWGDHVNTGSVDIPENTMKLGTMSITPGTGGTEPLTSLTMWNGETMGTAPIVKVVDENGDDITGYDLEWTSSNTDVATVDEFGKVTPGNPGVSIITAKATNNEGKTSSKSYTLYVNKVTGISFSPTTQGITLGGTLDVTATLEINGGNAINGDITNNLPVVTFASTASDKISVTSPVQATKDGDEYVATATATAAGAGAASISDQAVITASVGETTSNELTLTCTDTVDGVTLGTSTTTVWRYMGYTVPTVTVQGSGGTDLTSLATISWKLDNAPVTVNEGVISLSDAGEHTVTVTATYNNSEKFTSVTVYANEVTEISISPATTTVQKGGATTTLTATLTKTAYGDALANPTISWSSGSTDYVTVSPATGTSTTATGVAAGISTVTASIPADYMQSGVANTANSTVQCVTPSMTAFRGYEVSPGILMRTVDSGTSEVTYSLTDGSNPFEPAIYYNNNSSLNQYFLQWNTLKNELGADGSNIKADSNKLPPGWRMPTAGEDDTANPLATDWGRIIYGAPKSTITVGGTSVPNKAYVSVKVNLDLGNSYGVPQGTYYGMLLLRDGTNIPAGYFTMGGTYDNNPLTETQFKELLQDYGCVFISITGYYWVSWRYLPDREGYYWASNCLSSKGYYLGLNIPNGGFRLNSTKKASDYYYPVKLVKLVTD